MRVNITLSALVALVLFPGSGRALAQQSGSTLLASATTADTAAARERETRATSTSDTSTIDALGRGNASRDDRGGITDPSFLELRFLTSRHSTVPTRMPTTAYRDMYIVDLRAGWMLASNDFLSVEYAPSFVPLAISTRNPTAYVPTTTRGCLQGKECTNYSTLDISTVPHYTNTYGFGVTPVGLQLRFFRSSPVQLLTYANGGALWFTHRIPDPDATRFNFTAELGAAVQVNVPDRLGVVLGYSWHHTSNAGTGQVNPGINSHALSIGIVARRGR